MKTLTNSETKSIHSINNTLNQKVMKIKKYSLMTKAVMALAMMFLISGVTFSQTVEERKGGSSTYSVVAAAGGEEYRWTIEAVDAPASTSVAADIVSGSGTTGDPYITDWVADLTSIDVTWEADGSPDIASIAGIVTVQMRTNAGATCPSLVQTMDIAFWSEPTAAIDPTEVDLDVCSADAITGSITIDLTGAPDGGGNDGFDVIYEVAVSDALLTVSGTNGPVGAGQVVTSDGATVTIPLPDALVNTHASSQTYTITLTSVQDDFNDPAVAVLAQVYTITVHPIPTTGIITSTGSLTRRQAIRSNYMLSSDSMVKHIDV